MSNIRLIYYLLLQVLIPIEDDVLQYLLDVFIEPKCLSKQIGNRWDKGQHKRYFHCMSWSVVLIKYIYWALFWVPSVCVPIWSLQQSYHLSSFSLCYKWGYWDPDRLSKLAQDYIAGKWPSWNRNSGSLTPECT